jgi:hypothetical protein
MNDAPTADGGPGFLAFVAFFLLALALWFLMRNMNARMRRMSYRQQAAHRGKDDPQVAPGELERSGIAPGDGTDHTDDGVAPGPQRDGRNGGGSTEDGQDPDPQR